MSKLLFFTEILTQKNRTDLVRLRSYPDQIFPAAISVMLGGWWSMKTRFKSFMLSLLFNRIFGCSVDPDRYGFNFRMSTDLLFFGSRCMLIIAATMAAV